MCATLQARVAILSLAVTTWACEHTSGVGGSPAGARHAGTPANTASPAGNCPQLRPVAPEPVSVAVAPQRPLSLLTATIPFDLTSLQPAINRLIPVDLSDPAFPRPHKVADGVCATWFLRRNPIALRADNDRLRMSIPAELGVIAQLHSIAGCVLPPVSCGDVSAGVPPVPIEVNVSAPLTLDTSYRFSGVVANNGTVFRQPCSIVFGIINVTPHVKTIIDGQIDRQLPGINANLAQTASFQPQAQALWHAIQQPRRLSGDLWLVIRPQAVAAALRSATATQVTAQLSVSAEVELVRSVSPPAVAVVDLPPLGSPPNVPGGAHLRVVGSLGYGAITDHLVQALVGKQQRIIDAGRTVRVVTVRDVRVSGPVVCPDRTAACTDIAVQFDGDVCGLAHLVGRPEVDDAKQEIVLRDLDFSVETSNALLDLAVWLRRGDLVSQIANASHFSIANAVQRVNGALGTALQLDLTPQIQLTAAISSTSLSLVTSAAGLDYTVEIAAAIQVAIH